MSNNRLFGPDGQPVTSKPQQLITAKITARASLEHEPGEIAIEVEAMLPSFEAMQKLIARVNDATLALGKHAEIRAPVVKVRIYTSKAKSAQVLSWAQQIAAVSGGDTAHAFVQRDEEKKPDEEPGAETGETSTSG